MEGVIDDASEEAQKFMNKTETNRVSEPKKNVSLQVLQQAKLP